MMPPGTSVKLKTLRNGSERDVTVKLAEMSTETAKLNSQEEGGNQCLDGVEVSNLNPEIAKELGLPYQHHRRCCRTVWTPPARWRRLVCAAAGRDSGNKPPVCNICLLVPRARLRRGWRRAAIARQSRRSNAVYRRVIPALPRRALCQPRRAGAKLEAKPMKASTAPERKSRSK